MGAAFGLVGGMFSKGLDNVVAKSTDDIQHIVDNPKSAKEMQGESDKLANETETSINKAKTDGIQIPEEANQNIMAASAIHNAAVTKATVEDMVEKPQDYIDAVQKSELPDDKKQEVIDKINEVVAANDPKAIEAKPVIDKMNGLLKQVMNNDNNKALSDVEKDIKNKPLQAQVEELKKQVEDIYNKPTQKTEEPKVGNKPIDPLEGVKKDNPKTQENFMQNVEAKPIATVNVNGEEWTAHEVNGETVRNDYHQDFTQGGNPLAGTDGNYKYIPDKNVVVENTLAPVDKQATIVHEMLEYDAEKNDKMKYEKAHNEIANPGEADFRKQAEKNPDLTAKEFLDDYFGKKYGDKDGTAKKVSENGKNEGTNDGKKGDNAISETPQKGGEKETKEQKNAPKGLPESEMPKVVDGEKVAEEKEWRSVFDVPLERATGIIDKLVEQEKKAVRGGGVGTFMELRDAKESKAVINKY